MPTEAKGVEVEKIKSFLEDSSIAISTDYTGLNVSDMNLLRKMLRDNGVKYRVVKNTLMIKVAHDIDRPELKGLVDGPTGIVFGYGDPQIPTKILSDFKKNSGSDLKIRAGIMGDQLLTSDQIDELASLPPKEELISKLIGHLYGQISGLVYVLNRPMAGLVRVLQVYVEQENAKG